MEGRIGKRLGNYRLIQLLGEGGFAEVYLGEHIHLGTQAAIKILHTQLTAHDYEPFRAEARLVARLIHPHIVRVLDFGIEERTPFLVMDYAPNGTLRQRHPKGSRLPLATVVAYVKQVAEALQYAHNQRLVHRDVKPENILIGAQDELLLSDFGIALVVQSSHAQSTKDLAGTVAYMAPEQINAHPRPASDQYALGIVTYEWLSGARPFQGTTTEIVLKHSYVPPPSLRKQVPLLSPEVEQVIFTALAKQPEQRFSNVQAFARALEQASLGQQPATEASGEETLHAHPPLPQPPIMSETLVKDAVTDQAVHSLQTFPSTTPPAVSIQTTLPQREPGWRLSRRAVIAGLLVAGGVGAIGSVVYAERASQSAATRSSTTHSPNVRPTPKPTPSPTSLPAGTTLYIYRGHTDTVSSVAWSPDGKRIASGSFDGTVQVWDATDGSHVLTYRGQSNGFVYGVAWSPDGKRIASAKDDLVQVWNAVDGSNVLTYHGHANYVYTVAWSPDSKHVVSGSVDATAQVWNATDGVNTLIYHGHGYVVESVAWSPDGRRIASGGGDIYTDTADTTVQVWNATDGSHVFIYHGHSKGVWSVAWSPDGKRIASGSDDKTVQVWNTSDGGNVLTYRGLNSMRAVAWSPDGKRIACGSGDKTVRVWDASDAGNVLTYRGHNAQVRSVVWSPDGKHIASGSDDGTAQVWYAG